MSLSELTDLAWSARDKAHAPYSSFRVGAAIQTTSGKCFSGCNVEVANYGCTLCAERTAIVKAVSEGALRRGELLHVVVAADTERPTGPCGSCRQMIEEFAGADTEIHLSNRPGEIALRFTHRALLPHAFGPDNLLDSADDTGQR